MRHAVLADLVVALHVAYVGYVVVGVLLIWLGLWRKWVWVRNRWFRFTHLAAIAVVALEAALGIECPLTVWERNLRIAAGQSVTGESFIGRCLHGLLFYDLPPWAFTVLHLAFGLVVLATFLLAPPRRTEAVRASLPSGPA
jgi:hypothetical protein